jgi:hypothetical protein
MEAVDCGQEWLWTRLGFAPMDDLVSFLADEVGEEGLSALLSARLIA